MRIFDLSTITETIKNEKLQICVVSYGGSCSNQLVSTLIENGYCCKSHSWDKILCHCPQYVKLNIPIIYIYDNPIKAYLSMKNRGKGFWDLNQKKLSNNTDVPLSDENLLKLMIKNYNIWTKTRDQNVLVVKSRELFDTSIVDKLKKFLKNDKLQHFPIPYVVPRTNTATHSDSDTKLFLKYKTELDEIMLKYI